MKNLINIFLIAISFSAVTSCVREIEPQETPEETDKTPILPVKITYANEVSIFHYDNDKLKEIITDNDKEIYTYDGDDIVKTEEYISGTLARTWNYTYNTNGQLIKIVMTAPGNVNEISTLTWSDKNHFLFKRENTTWEVELTNNNLTKKTVKVDGESNVGTHTFTYDGNNNPYKNIKGYNKVNIIYAFDGSANNVTKEEWSTTSPVSNNVNIYSHEYNADQFPTKTTAKLYAGTPQESTSTDIFEYNK